MQGCMGAKQEEQGWLVSSNMQVGPDKQNERSPGGVWLSGLASQSARLG